MIRRPFLGVAISCSVEQRFESSIFTEVFQQLKFRKKFKREAIQSLKTLYAVKSISYNQGNRDRFI